MHLVGFWILDNTIAGFKTIPSRYTWCSFNVRNRVDSISSWTRRARSISYSPLFNISGSTMGTIRALWQMLANLNKNKELLENTLTKICYALYIMEILYCAMTVSKLYILCNFHMQIIAFIILPNFKFLSMYNTIIVLSKLWKAYIYSFYDIFDEVYCAAQMHKFLWACVKRDM